MPNCQQFVRLLLVAVAIWFAAPIHAADRPIKAFISPGSRTWWVGATARNSPTTFAKATTEC